MERKTIPCKRIALFLLPLLWMGLIFVFSAQTGAESGAAGGRFIRFFVPLLDSSFKSRPSLEQEAFIESFQPLSRVIGHLAAFGILGFLFALALKGNFSRKTSKRILLKAVLFCALYGLLDEIHQLFVPGRAFQFSDLLCDSIGALVGAGLFLLLCRLFKGEKRRLMGRNFQIVLKMQTRKSPDKTGLFSVYVNKKTAKNEKLRALLMLS